jgi:shikimate kinase
MTRHIFLIGFMGSGKTHWGRVLAEKLGAPFLDLDDFIEENEGKTIAEIFAESGENAFRALEKEYLRRLAALPPTVVAAGGGTPCFFDNMAWMKQLGLTIYLETSPEILFERLKNERDQRPLLQNLDEDELKNFIQNRLNERESFYRKADIVVKSESELHDLIEILLQ